MKGALIRLLKIFAKQKAKLIIICISAVLSCATYAFMPIFSGRAIDGVINALQNLDSFGGVFDALIRSAGTSLLILFLLGLASCGLAYLQQYIAASAGEELTYELRKRVNAKLTRLPLKYFDSHSTGDIMSHVTNDLEKVSEVMQTGLMQFVTSIMNVGMMIIMMLILNPILTLIALTAIVIAAIATNVVSKKSRRYFAENQKILGELSAKTEEFYSGASVLKAFNYQDEAIDDMLEVSREQYKTVRKAEFFNYSIYPFIRFLNRLGLIATAAVGSIMAINGVVTIGTVSAFMQYVNQIAEPIAMFSYVINSLQGALAGAERVFDLLDEEEEIPDSTEPLPDGISQGRVRFEHVEFGYSPDRPLMRDISFEVKPNQTAAIVGPTGGGKTTLVNLLMRFYEINGGRISIDGVDIKRLSRRDLRGMIGMVLQDAWLFGGTVAENIAYGKPDATMEQIIAAAKAARCHHFIKTLPKGYETVISGDNPQISQGQMQLLTIARAMLADPLIMILDEATSSVDTRTEAEIQKAMYAAMKDKTSFVIAHRLSTIKNADLILVVKNGDIIETGNHKSLLAQNGFYASLYNSQFV